MATKRSRGRHLSLVPAPSASTLVVERPRGPSVAPPCRPVDDLIPAQCPAWCEYFHPPVPEVPPVAELARGTLVDGRYRIVRQIGRGGMGEVYEADDPQAERVALKRVRPSLTSDPEILGRFAAEAHALESVDHANVVGFRAFGYHHGLPFLAMERISGGSLETHLKGSCNNRLGIAQALQILASVCCGAQAMHDAGVVHHDLKAGNVFFTGQRRVVIGDLGMARPLAACCRVPRGRIEGTPAYLAPEHATGAGERSLPTADVYSLGILAARMLTGRVPFCGTQREVLEAQVSQAPERPSLLRPELPRELDDIILWALDKDPCARPMDAAAFGRALRTLEAAPG